MKPSYITLVGTTPIIVPVNPHIAPFAVSIRPPAGTPTIEYTLENPDDFMAPNTYTPRAAPAGAAVAWLTAPAAVNGVHLITAPCSAVRITPSAGGQATVVQSGID